MAFINVEIKARIDSADELRGLLLVKDPRFVGTDHQIDTYFNVQNGRLKLRQGSIEKHLIFYERPNISGPKTSLVSLFKADKNSDDLLNTLDRALGKKVVVDKHREIYYIGNVKFHIDQVQDLGSFMEIEAMECPDYPDQQSLQEQCDYYMEYLKVKPENLIHVSYSDLLMQLDADK